MFQFLETIQIKNGKAQQLMWHQKRIDNTLLEVFGVIEHSINLQAIFKMQLNNNAFPKEKNQLFKCRFLYNNNDFSIAYLPYSKKIISNLKLVSVPADFDYHLKYSNRDNLNQLINDNQEVIIVKNNKITDTTYTNIAFLKEDKWFTPDEPLLHGTMRAYLIDKKTIIPRPIAISDLADFSHFKLFNAMMNWNDAEILPISAIER